MLSHHLYIVVLNTPAVCRTAICHSWKKRAIWPSVNGWYSAELTGAADKKGGGEKKTNYIPSSALRCNWSTHPGGCNCVRLDEKIMASIIAVPIFSELSFWFEERLKAFPRPSFQIQLHFVYFQPLNLVCFWILISSTLTRFFSVFGGLRFSGDGLIYCLGPSLSSMFRLLSIQCISLETNLK